MDPLVVHMSTQGYSECGKKVCRQLIPENSDHILLLHSLVAASK